MQKLLNGKKLNKNMKSTFTFLVIVLILTQYSCNKKSQTGIGSGKNGNCWCTEGQAKTLGITNYPDAYKWTSSTLSPAGNYQLANYPSLNDIAVLNSYYHSSGPDAYAGHVARVKKIVPGSNGNTITFWGTNQTADASKWHNECGCDNFSDWSFFVYNSDIISGNIKFFHLSNPLLSCGSLFIGSTSTDKSIISITGDMNFGETPINTTVSRSLTISNPGSISYTINSISLPSGYEIESLISGYILTSGKSVTVQIKFKPTQIQSYNGTLSINSTATSGSSNIQLTGSGINITSSFIPITVTPSINSYSKSSTFTCTGYGTFDGTVLMSRIININATTGTITFEICKQNNSTFNSSGNVGIAKNNQCAADLATSQYIQGKNITTLTYTPSAGERTGSITYYIDAQQTTGTYIGYRYSCGQFTLTY